MDDHVKKRIETWTPITISVCALFLTIYQAHKTEEHDRLSVQPKCGLGVEIEPAKVELRINNFGLGPGKITGLHIRYNGQYQSGWSALERNIPGLHATHAANPSNVYVLPGSHETLLIASWEPPKDGDVDSDPIRQQVVRLFFQDFRYDICYCSMYSECWFATAALGTWQVADFHNGCPATDPGPDFIGLFKEPAPGQ
jgi:hypothetical protein